MPTPVSDISTQRIAKLYPGLRPLAFRVLQDVSRTLGFDMNLVEGFRSMDEQLAVYAKGRTLTDGKWSITDSSKIVTNAKPGLSFHCYGLAFDCAWAGLDPYLSKLSNAECGLRWRTYGDLVRAHGLTWGGNFRLLNGVSDLPHAELSYGLKISDCVELYQHDGIKSVWAQIDKIRGVPQGQDWDLS